MTRIPDHVARLLWDADPERIDLERAEDRALVMERVMSRGTLESMRWLRRSFAVAELAEFVRTHGETKLTPRDHAYWALVCDVEAVPRPGGGRPGWAGS